MRSFRAQIVASTIALVATVMVAVVVGTQLVLELGEGHPRAPSSWDMLVATALVGASGVALSGFVAWRVSQRALDPVHRMAERAEEWSAQNLEHRFGLGDPRNELSQLGQTLDRLLDRVARAIRDEQRLTAELAHEIRTPLTAIRGCAELALARNPEDAGLRADLTEIASASDRLASVVAALLELATSPDALRGTSDPAVVVDHVAGLVHAPIQLTVGGSAPAIAGPVALVARALAPLLENASRHASSEVRVVIRGEDVVEIAVRDDGPGVPPELRATIFEPGASSHGSSGLGLAIARRVARSLGGDAFLQGGEFVLRLPRA